MRYSPDNNQTSYTELMELAQGSVSHMVSAAEAHYNSQMEEIAKRAMAENRRAIFVTGPSASGKTTTAKRLGSFLEACGNKVNRISLDNFYRRREDLPRWEDGYQNYESIEGLDIPLFHDVMEKLINTGEAESPVFDFAAGCAREKGIRLKYDEQTFLIIEGIHALNPLVYQAVSDLDNLKVYISVHTEILDNQSKVLYSPRQLRLARRMLRDYHYRATDPHGTLRMWNYVLMGEELYIFPYRKNADYHIDSFHSFEPFIYKNDLQSMLAQVDEGSFFYPLAQNLMAASVPFVGLSYDIVPKTSLIQEFIKPNAFFEDKIDFRDV